MNEIAVEFFGTFLLVLLGNGVVANVVLNDTIDKEILAQDPRLCTW